MMARGGCGPRLRPVWRRAIRRCCCWKAASVGRAERRRRHVARDSDPGRGAQRNAARLATAEALQKGGAQNATAREVMPWTGYQTRPRGDEGVTNPAFEIARDRSTTQVPAGNIIGRGAGRRVEHL